MRLVLRLAPWLLSVLDAFAQMREIGFAPPDDDDIALIVQDAVEVDDDAHDGEG